MIGTQQVHLIQTKDSSMFSADIRTDILPRLAKEGGRQKN